MMHDPLFINDYYFPSFIVIFLIALFCSLPKKSQHFSVNQVDLLVILFGGYYMFCSLAGTSSRQNIYDFYFLLCYLLLYGCIKASATEDHRPLPILSLAMLIIFSYEAMLTIVQFLGFSKGRNTFFPVSGSFISPALLTNFMCLAYPLISHYLEEKRLAKLSILLFLVLAVVCFMTDSKLSWLVLSVLLVFKLVKSSKRRLPSFYFLVAFAGLTVIIVAILLQDSTNGRFLILKGSFSLWTENWFKGIGINQFDRQYNLFQAEHLMHNPHSPYYYLASYVQVAYNDFLQIALELGVFGFLFLGYSVALTFTNWTRYPQYIQEAMLMILMIAMFSFPFQTSSTLTLCIVYFALAATFHPPLVLTSAKISLIKATLATASVALLFISFQIQNALLVWKLAVRNPAVADQAIFREPMKVLENNKDFQLALANILFLKTRYAESVCVLNKAALHSSSIDIFLLLALNYEAMGNLDLAESNYRESMKLVPSFLKPKFLLMMLYLKNRRLEDAKGIARTILHSRIKIKNKESDYILTAAKKISNL